MRIGRKWSAVVAYKVVIGANYRIVKYRDYKILEKKQNCVLPLKTVNSEEKKCKRFTSLVIARLTNVPVGAFLVSDTKSGTFPIDTTKTRLQIQGQKIDEQYGRLKYRGMIDAFLQISKQEGFWALYSGLWPAVLRQATYGTIKFGTYYSLKAMIEGEEEDVAINVCCAVVAGMVSSAIANPTDVLKVRMQVLGMQAQRGMVGCFQDVYRHEGVGGLWRGVGPTAQRAAVIAAVELPVYDFCKHHFKPIVGDSVSNHFMSSFIASLGSAIASTPIDVIRTRLMNQRRLKKSFAVPVDTRLYTGSADCLVQTVRHEGLLALYKGFVPTWVRMGPWNIIFFITYEQLKRLY